MRGRSAKTLLPLLLCCLMLEGCWDVEEVNRRATVDTLFLDFDRTGRVRMGGSFQIPGTLLPPYNEAEQLLTKRHHMLYGEGQGALDAWKELQTHTMRGIFFTQLRALIISEAYARKDLPGLLDFIDRAGEVPTNIDVLITGTDPRDLLSMKINNNIVPGNYIADYFQIPYKRTLAKPIKLWQVEAILLNGTSDLYLPYIEPSQGQYRIAGEAVFAKDAWAGKLSVAETQLMSMLQGSSGGYLTVPLGGEKLAAFGDVSSRARIEVTRLRNGTLQFEIKLRVEGVLRETRPKIPRVTLGDEKYYINRAERLLERNVQEFLRKLQNLGSDPIGFGNKVRIKYPRYWRRIDWHQVFPRATFRVRVDFTIKNTGMFW